MVTDHILYSTSPRPDLPLTPQPTSPCPDLTLTPQPTLAVTVAYVRTWGNYTVYTSYVVYVDAISAGGLVVSSLLPQ